MLRKWLSNRQERRRRPSLMIRRHLDRTGNGFELSDLVDCDYPDWQDVVEKVLDINRRHTLEGEPPLGVYKDSARPELVELAEELEAVGR
jgi:hypothetical protein